MYQPAIDVARITAIDTHVHVEQGPHGQASLPAALAEAAARYFKAEDGAADLASVAARYRGLGMAAVVFSVDARTNLGHEPISSETLIDQASDHADVLVPFASVDPLRDELAVEQLRALVLDRGARGLKLHPTVQGFDPSDERFRPLWAAAEELGVPVIVHTGQTGIGAGTPGGYGLKMRYSNPLLLDDVAADFPRLQIILAHPSVPWQDEAISVATHKANVAIDLSGWRPKYFPPQLVRAASSFLQDKVLFGSDFPLITPTRWLDDFQQLEIKDAVRPKILKDNAVRLLGLSTQAPPDERH